ncbi:MAG: addiction module antidote protein, HigA family, partial [Treponema sp.]|nr:addiction module antidote protein, HigA family [Treponema sp.]
LGNKAKISLRIALHLSKYFGNPVQYWVELQNTYDLAQLEGDPELADILKKLPKAKKQPLSVKKTASAEKSSTAKRGAAKKDAASPRKPRRQKASAMGNE